MGVDRSQDRGAEPEPRELTTIKLMHYESTPREKHESDAGNLKGVFEGGTFRVQSLRLLGNYHMQTLRELLGKLSLQGVLEKHLGNYGADNANADIAIDFGPDSKMWPTLNLNERYTRDNQYTFGFDPKHIPTSTQPLYPYDVSFKAGEGRVRLLKFKASTDKRLAGPPEPTAEERTIERLRKDLDAEKITSATLRLEMSKLQRELEGARSETEVLRRSVVEKLTRALEDPGWTGGKLKETASKLLQEIDTSKKRPK